MKRKILSLALCFIANTTFGQSTTTINILNDTVINNTILVDGSNVIINGNNKSVTLNGNPKFKVINNGILLIKNMKIQNKQNWGAIGPHSELQWYNVGMKGCLVRASPLHFNSTFFLDGEPKN
jgi:hypothetical protein